MSCRWENNPISQVIERKPFSIALSLHFGSLLTSKSLSLNAISFLLNVCEANLNDIVSSNFQFKEEIWKKNPTTTTTPYANVQFIAGLFNVSWNTTNFFSSLFWAFILCIYSRLVYAFHMQIHTICVMFHIDLPPRFSITI